MFTGYILGLSIWLTVKSDFEMSICMVISGWYNYNNITTYIYKSQIYLINMYRRWFLFVLIISFHLPVNIILNNIDNQKNGFI